MIFSHKYYIRQYYNYKTGEISKEWYIHPALVFAEAFIDFTSKTFMLSLAFDSSCGDRIIHGRVSLDLVSGKI